MQKIALMSLSVTTALLAGGYKIPESSVNAVALSNAYVANANGADASYYNPANMVLNKNKGGAIEVDLTYIGLGRINYAGKTNFYNGTTLVATDPRASSSESEDFLVPTLFYVSPALGDFRFGLSIVSPAGLSKQWKSDPSAKYAQEFTLKTIEVNPTIAYKLNDQLAVAFGARGVYSSGKVKNALYTLDGTGMDWGYNLALTLKPDKDTNVAVTYRSQIGLHVSGDTSTTVTTINSGVKVTLPLPATLTFAASHTFNNTTTVEALLEHNVWSAYDKLNFNFNSATNETNLGKSIAKNWEDMDTFRIGITHKYEKISAMAGFAYDPSPIPNATFSYELPDTTGKIFSLGGRYDISSRVNIGIAGLVDVEENRKINNAILSGEISHGRAYLVSLGMEYKF
ncbi:MAG: outer membrane protein transport protein [Thiovulaceae bacterium]|nr:outer membrane protein transport protein [Sulfurimonadaceae bacterium]